jgi:hypothetical protein
MIVAAAIPPAIRVRGVMCTVIPEDKMPVMIRGVQLTVGSLQRIDDPLESALTALERLRDRSPYPLSSRMPTPHQLSVDPRPTSRQLSDFFKYCLLIMRKCLNYRKPLS